MTAKRGRPVRAWSVEGNRQRLDGGAMYGNVPRALWERWSTPDEAHRIPLACRALLIQEDSGRRVLFEVGIGAFFAPKLRARFGVEPKEHALLRRLAALGVQPDEVDVIVLSHLHFDHAGGLLTAWQPDREPALAFPRATVVVGAAAWARALAPHPRDQASFIPRLHALLMASGRLDVMDGPASQVLGDAYRFHFSDGHTPGLMLAEVPADDGPIVFAGDLVPGRPWVHLPITMGYDRYPELLIDEKTALLADLETRGGRLFYTHDPEAAMSRVVRDAHGRFSAGETWPTLDGLTLS